jgi:aminoglycoside 6'-N-acetyltransferase
MTRYRFAPMTAADLPLIRRWLATPHVIEWWGDTEEQFALVSGDLGEPAMDQFIVALDEKPFAYLQCYNPEVWPEGGLGTHPHGTRGIDQFIGEPDFVGHGHGSAFIRDFTDKPLAAGVPRVITDPNPENRRAMRAYEKAGFRKDRRVDTSDGPSLLMIRELDFPVKP